MGKEKVTKGKDKFKKLKQRDLQLSFCSLLYFIMLPSVIQKFAKGYIRVSTQLQKDDGTSLEIQCKRIHDYCNYKNFELVKIYSDPGVSGKSIDGRPQMKALLDDIQKDDYIIFTDLSRMSRSTLDSLSIIQQIANKKAFFVCLALDIDASTPNGSFMIQVLCAFNELERKNTAAKVSYNMKVLSQQGKLRNRCPFGYKFVGKDKDFEPEPTQQEVIKIIINLYNQGHNPNKIAAILNTQGYGPTLNLNKTKISQNPMFYQKTVQRILADHGLLEMKDRKNADQRIKTYHPISSSL